MSSAHFYQVVHRTSSGILISESFLRESDNEAESTENLYEVIRFTPEFGWRTATQNRVWGRHWVTVTPKGVTVTPMTDLPDYVHAQLP